jgi:nitrogen fixation NifU-like protein
LISDLQELYQEVILDHNKNPRNFRSLPDANRSAEGHNPLCGDHVTIFLHLEGDVIRDISFQGSGCAISKASASMMTASLKGKTRAEAETLFARFHRMVTGEMGPDEDPLEMGKLAAFAGVCEFPVRVKCASLAWHTMSAALEGSDQAVTTE